MRILIGLVFYQPQEKLQARVSLASTSVTHWHTWLSKQTSHEGTMKPSAQHHLAESGAAPATRMPGAVRTSCGERLREWAAGHRPRSREPL